MHRVIALSLLCPSLMFAQGVVTPLRLVGPGDPFEAVARLRALVDPVAPDDGLRRSTAAIDRSDPTLRRGWGIVVPTIETRWNAPLPSGGNDGELRAMRGLNVQTTAGAAFRSTRLSLVIAPQLVFEENRPFFVIPWDQVRQGPRSVWAHPYLPSPESADWPIRFGVQPRRQLTPGQSRAAVELASHARVGFSTENRWWGPGHFNALLLSSNAPGFPHAFFEMPAPWITRHGTVDLQYLLGTLHESPYFDADPANDRRSLSAFALTWRPPARWRHLPSLGIARGVMAPGPAGVEDLVGAWRDVGRPVSDPDGAAGHGRRDQITDLWLRWHLPESGFEAYAEWARYEFPASLTDFLAFPGHTQGYTIGMQVARPSIRSSMLHLRTEMTYAEPSSSLLVRPTGLSYTSPVIPQGWTHEGQMLGPAIGPGASSQHLAADWHGKRRRVGVTFGRIRWLNGPVFTPVVPNKGMLSDVSLFGTLRTAFAWRGIATQLEVTRGVRLAYMNLTYLRDPALATYDGWDFRTWSIGITLTPEDRAFFFRR